MRKKCHDKKSGGGQTRIMKGEMREETGGRGESDWRKKHGTWLGGGGGGVERKGGGGRGRRPRNYKVTGKLKERNRNSPLCI